MKADQIKITTQKHKLISPKNTTNVVTLVFVGAVMLLIGIIVGHFFGNVQVGYSKLPNQHITTIFPTPNIVLPKEEVVYKSDWATFYWKQIDYKKHSANLYIDTTGSDGVNAKLLMSQISLENIPVNVVPFGNRFIFEFVGPGDGNAYFVSNMQPPFNVKILKLPSNYPTVPYIIGWVNNNTIIYKQTTGSDPKSQKVIYWIASVDDVVHAKQVLLQ